MNRTPHVVGGGLGSIRKEAAARRVAEAKVQQQADTKAALAALRKSVGR